MSGLPFLKVEGTRNDFVLLDGNTPLPANLPALAPALCDRRSGIGADGVLAARGGPDGFMRMWNPDGSEAENCGNGLRCVAAWLHGRGELGEVWLPLRTLGGPVDIRVEDGDLGWYGVRFPSPEAASESVAIPGAGAGLERWTRVSVGNPHGVIRCADVQAAPVDSLGRAAQEAVPGGINVEWAQQTGPAAFSVRIFERGAGETASCGSGVTAAAAAAWAEGWSDADELTVTVPGGTLRVRRDGDRVVLSGPARICYRGSFPWAGPTAPVNPPETTPASEEH